MASAGERSNLQAQVAHDLPRAPVLSYLTGTDTPTRVRVVASRAVLVLAIIEAVVAMPASILICMRLERMVFVYRFLWGMSTWDAWIHVVGSYWIPVFLLLMLLIHAIVLFIFFRAVHRGNVLVCRAACVLVALWVVPLGLFTAFSGIVGIYPIYARMTDSDQSLAPAMMLLLVPLGILLLVLLKDLCTFLNWISRMPSLEKPPESFMPANASSGSDA